MNAFYCTLALVLGADPTPGVLLLDDFSLVQGQVELFGDIVRVTENGKTRLIPKREVLFRAASRDDAYKFVRAKFDPDSAAAKLQLAAWFAKVGDADRALLEARTAAVLAPADEPTKEAVRKYEAAARTVVKPKAVAVAAASSPAPPVPPESVIVFGRLVQPILANACANCHAAKGYAGSFKLERLSESYANATALAANLVAASAALDRTNPAASPLLVKALEAHGGKPAAFANGNHPAFRNLALWSYATVGPIPLGKPVPPPAVVAKVEPVKPLEAPKRVELPKAVEPAKASDPFDPATFHGLRK